MKLNNKGFAITSVLYGLLILFVVLVGTYLTILSAQKNRVDTLVEGIEENYNSETCIDNPNINDLCWCVEEETIIAPYTGKYKIDTLGSGSQEISLKKGEDICKKVKPDADYCNFGGGEITVTNVCYKTGNGGYNE